jgi:hypothetical protein
MIYKIILIALTGFDLGTKTLILGKPKFILLAEALCSQASSTFWDTFYETLGDVVKDFRQQTGEKV